MRSAGGSFLVYFADCFILSSWSIIFKRSSSLRFPNDVSHENFIVRRWRFMSERLCFRLQTQRSPGVVTGVRYVHREVQHRSDRRRLLQMVLVSSVCSCFACVRRTNGRGGLHFFPGRYSEVTTSSNSPRWK